MHVLALIRHAIAEDRRKWSGDDDAQRPLNAKGQRQARRLASMLPELLIDAGLKIVALRCSPAVRCVQTVEPLAATAGIVIAIDKSLMEDSEMRLPSPRQPGAHVLCAHGDNIPWALEELGVDWDERCKKGSVWLIQRDAKGRVTQAVYRVAESV